MSDFNLNDIPDGPDEGDEDFEPSGENSIDTDNEAYVGTEATRANHAYDTDAPALPEEDDDAVALYQRQKDYEAANAFKSGDTNRQGSTVRGIHPSDREVYGKNTK